MFQNINIKLSELPWSATDPIFPHHSVILKYIEEYYKIYNLDKHLLFNTKVIKAEKVEQENKQFPKWNIHYLNLTTNNKKCEMFDFLIIASGLNTNAIYPNMPQLKNFRGDIMHSIDYKEPRKYKNKNVLVIGGAFSGTEISCEVSLSANKVINHVRNPLWVVPRFQFCDNFEKILPHDIQYSRGEKSKLDMFDKFSLDRLKTQADVVHSYLNYKTNNNDNIKELTVKSGNYGLTFSDNYLNYVKKGYIEVKNGEITDIKHEGKDGKVDMVYFSDGSSYNVDSIILCTGLKINVYEYLEEEVLKTINFDKDDHFMPMILYKAVFHPAIKSLGFIGQFKAMNWREFELEARYITMLFSKLINYPDDSLAYKHLKNEENLRKWGNELGLQWPYANLSFPFSLANEIGCLPNYDKIKTEDPELYDILCNYPIVNNIFRIEGKFNQKEKAIGYLRHFKQLIKPKF